MTFKRMIQSNLPEFMLKDCLKRYGLDEYGYEMLIELEPIWNDLLADRAKKAGERKEREKDIKAAKAKVKSQIRRRR